MPCLFIFQTVFIISVGEHMGCGNNSCDEFCFNVQGDDLTYSCGCIVGKQLNDNGISCDMVSGKNKQSREAVGPTRFE